MLKFIKKTGERVMEMNEQGEIHVLDGALKESMDKNILVEAKKEKENE